MTDVNLTVTGSVEALHLEPGDRIIVTIDRQAGLTTSGIAQIKEAIEGEFPDHSVLVLNGLRIAKETHA